MELNKLQDKRFSISEKLRVECASNTYNKVLELKDELKSINKKIRKKESKIKARK